MKILRLIIIGTVLIALAGCYGLPLEKTNIRNGLASPQLEAEQGKVKVVIIRPYDYNYYGHAVDVLINNISRTTIPNQSFSVLSVNPGVIEVRGQSGLLGPPTRDIRIDGSSGEVVYLLWETTTSANYTSVVPIIGVHWQKISKEEATIFLKNVEYVQPKNAVRN